MLFNPGRIKINYLHFEFYRFSFFLILHLFLLPYSFHFSKMIAPPEKTMEDGIVNKINEDSILTSIDDENVDNYLTLEKEINESKKQRIMIDENMEEKSAVADEFLNCIAMEINVITTNNVNSTNNHPREKNKKINNEVLTVEESVLIDVGSSSNMKVRV